MYGSYFPHVDTTAIQQPSSSMQMPNAAGADPKSGWPAGGEVWGDSYVSDNVPRMQARAAPPPAYGAPKNVFPMSAWSTQQAPHFATPSSSGGSPASPQHPQQNAAPQRPQPPAQPQAAAQVQQPAAPSSSAAAKEEPKKAPRPPNAWILYRSEMLGQIRDNNGEMPPALAEAMRTLGCGDDTGGSGSDAEAKKKGKKATKSVMASGKAGRGLPQAHISQIISLLWKKESEEVRRRYEQLAEVKKLEVSKCL
jgi:hypothetical protein